jgi:RNA polymerase-binding transcription factor
MNGRQIHQFKRILENMKAELDSTIQKSLDRLVISQSADPVDHMCNLTEQELSSRNISLLIIRLRDLEVALRAIREGNFGRCANCDGQIPLRRLEAVPWSSCCVACQQAAEARAAEPGKVQHGDVAGYVLSTPV